MVPGLSGSTPAYSGGAGGPASELGYVPAKLPTACCWEERFLHWAANWACCCARARSGVAKVESRQALLVGKGTLVEVTVSSGHAVWCAGDIMAPCLLHAEHQRPASPSCYPARAVMVHKTYASGQLVLNGHAPELFRAKASSQQPAEVKASPAMACVVPCMEAISSIQAPFPGEGSVLVRCTGMIREA